MIKKPFRSTFIFLLAALILIAFVYLVRNFNLPIGTIIFQVLAYPFIAGFVLYGFYLFGEEYLNVLHA